jgi:hypothetical protein
MSFNGAQDRHFVIIDGNVATSGGSLNIANGQLAVINASATPTQNGRKVVSAFAGLPKQTDFQIKVGKAPVEVNRSQTDKDFESLPFKLSEVADFKVYAPKAGQGLDSFIIGYNGKNGTEITVKENSSSSIDITLCGEPIKYLGYKNGEVTVSLYLEYPYVDADGYCKDCANGVFTMQEVIEKAVAVFNNMLLLGQTPITDYVEALVVNSENVALLGGVDYSSFTLTVADKGDYSSLGKVQAQFPSYTVLKSDRVGEEETVYTIVAPAGTTLADYSVSKPSLIKGCEECPAGYDELEAGVVYSIEIEDDGSNLATTIDDVPGFVTGTVVKVAQNGGVGVYTVVVDNALTDDEIATFKAASATKATSVFYLAGDVNAVCENTTTVDYSWVEGETCNTQPVVYKITLADDECGASRLTELQAAYPDLTISVDTENLEQTVTITGTDGTANITVNGVEYLVTFDTDLATTAAAFVTDHAADILAATGAVVTSTGAVIKFVDSSDSFPVISIANATEDLAGTLAAVIGNGATNAGLCQTTYRTTVYTNLICEDCSDEFRALFSANAPADYGITSWETTDKAYSETAKMGIKFNAKPFILAGSEEYRDDMPFSYTSTRLKVAGGFPEMIAENWNSNLPYAVKVLSIASDPEALGGHLRVWEDISRVYFDGEARLEGNNYGKWILGQETKLKATAQYVDYALTVEVKKNMLYTPNAPEKITYHVWAEVGRHEAIETLLNKLATAAGLPAVQAYGK